MRVHHLNCATMCPYGGRLLGASGGPLSPGRLVCHCLLVESADGLVLVDSGLGTRDLAQPRSRLGAEFVAFVRPRLDVEECAVRRIERLGLSPRDVRHVVLTHLDLDHAGGIADFPEAQVHVLDLEHDAATFPRGLLARARYRAAHWSHGPVWVLHRTRGERWLGFECVQAIAKLGPDLLLVPLPGHTRGHCAIAVREPEGWLVHAGDAYFHRSEMDARPSAPGALAAFQRLVATDVRAQRENQARLRELARERAGEVRVFCAHDPVELERFQERSSVAGREAARTAT